MFQDEFFESKIKTEIKGFREKLRKKGQLR